MHTIGEALAAWRSREGYLIRQAAAFANVDPGQWSRWENGALDPSPLNREKLARLGVLTSDEAQLPREALAA